MPSTPTGRLIRKTHCQEATSTKQHPRAGPSNGPNRPGSVIRVITRINFSGGYSFSTASLPTGISIAPPTACSRREATGCVRFDDSAHSRDPAQHKANAD